MAKPDEILRKTTEILSTDAAQKRAEKEQYEKERRELVSSVGKEIAAVIAPTLNQMISAQQVTTDMMRAMLKEIKVEAPQIPKIELPPINVPRPNVVVKAPDVKIPQVNVPEPKVVMPDNFKVTMDQYSKSTPLPVMMMDTKGKPMSFSMGAGGGGKADFFTIKNIIDSSGASIINNDGALKVTGDLTVTGSASSTLAQLVNAEGTYYDSDNPLPTTASIAADTGSGEIGGDTLRTVQATDAIASVEVKSGTITAVTDITNSVATYQLDAEGNYRGTYPVEGTLTAVTDITNSVAVYPLDAEGNYRGTQPVEGTVAVSGVTASVAAALVDSSGVAYSGSNPVPISDAGGSVTVDGTVAVSGVTGSVVVNLQNQDGTTYDGDNPLPTVNKPINVRGSMATAYATISTDAATTVLAGVASTYLDLVYVMGANQSDGAVTLDFYTGAGGATMLSLEIPANSTAGVAPAAAVPMTEAAQAWYVYYADSDVTGTTVDITALFSKEV